MIVPEVGHALDEGPPGSRHTEVPGRPQRLPMRAPDARILRVARRVEYRQHRCEGTIDDAIVHEPRSQQPLDGAVQLEGHILAQFGRGVSEAGPTKQVLDALASGHHPCHGAPLLPFADAATTFRPRSITIRIRKRSSAQFASAGPEPAPRECALLSPARMRRSAGTLSGLCRAPRHRAEGIASPRTLWDFCGKYLGRVSLGDHRRPIGDDTARGRLAFRRCGRCLDIRR